MEATILIKFENDKDLTNILQQVRIDLNRGVKEYEDNKVRFRVHQEVELPMFGDVLGDLDNLTIRKE